MLLKFRNNVEAFIIIHTQESGKFNYKMNNKHQTLAPYRRGLLLISYMAYQGS